MEPNLGLLLLVPGIVSSLEPLELCQGGRRRLVQEQCHGFSLLWLGHEHGVASQHDRLVLQLVPVDPVGDPVQKVEVAGSAQHDPRAARGASEGALRTDPPPQTLTKLYRLPV
uniref:Secreted protein n=1 Tax=Astyanax mexicanus TaxID=7994 RepID=A0A8B9KNM2_ASTMX